MKTPEQIAVDKERERVRSRSRRRASTPEQKAQRRIYVRERYHQNKERAAAIAKKSWFKKSAAERYHICKKSILKRKYGLTFSEYEDMIAQSGGRCAICFRDVRDVGRGKFCIDHDHSTGKVRGLLCDSCNVGLGRFEDNIASLQSAIEYLRRHSPE